MTVSGPARIPGEPQFSNRLWLGGSLIPPTFSRFRPRYALLLCCALPPQEVQPWHAHRRVVQEHVLFGMLLCFLLPLLEPLADVMRVKILFDQNLSHRLVSSLSDVFADAAHVRDFGLARADDELVWTFAMTAPG